MVRNIFTIFAAVGAILSASSSAFGVGGAGFSGPEGLLVRDETFFYAKYPNGVPDTAKASFKVGRSGRASGAMEKYCDQFKVCAGRGMALIRQAQMLERLRLALQRANLHHQDTGAYETLQNLRNTTGKVGQELYDLTVASASPRALGLNHGPMLEAYLGKAETRLVVHRSLRALCQEILPYIERVALTPLIAAAHGREKDDFTLLEKELNLLRAVVQNQLQETADPDAVQEPAGPSATPGATGGAPQVVAAALSSSVQQPAKEVTSEHVRLLAMAAKETGQDQGDYFTAAGQFNEGSLDPLSVSLEVMSSSEEEPTKTRLLELAADRDLIRKVLLKGIFLLD